MNRDRLTQTFALTLTLGCLVAAALLMPAINTQRRDLQLSYDIEVGDRVDPSYALTAAALGSFRGLAVDVLWYRAERLKEEGKFWEAATLAEWITTLQPRFPQVWSFHAWNMAYNISVQTHTPEERWNWVNKGIRLLREEGIPANPTAILLYRELGWIFFHKIGQYADDMNRFYKLKLAEEWQEVLGTPVQSVDADGAVEQFRPIAEAADRYLQLNRPSYEMRQQLAALMEQHQDYAEELNDLRRRGLDRFMDRAPRLISRLREQGQRALADQVEAMLEPAQERLARSGRDSLTLLYNDVPATREVVAALRANGLDADEMTVRRIGRLEMYLMYVPLPMLVEQGREMFGLSEQDIRLVHVLMDAEHQEGVAPLLAYLRARTLVNQYEMDPTFMLGLMEEFGPLDWRHAASHAVYWSALGVDMIEDVRNRANIDLLNTNRQVVHGLQSLMRTGSINYDPLADEIDLLPDPDFIPGYEKAMYAAEERAIAMGLGSQGTLETFEGGHENFLRTATVYTYLYGNQEKAQGYYDRARELYGDNRGNMMRGTYTRTLDDFVLVEITQEQGGMQQHQAQQFVDAMITNALREGLAQGRIDVFNRFMRLAERGFERYQAGQTYTNPNAGEGRLDIASSFAEQFTDSYINYMKSPQNPLTARSRVYLNTPTPMRRATYPYFRNDVQRQAAQLGFDPDRAFPPPPEGDEAAPAPEQPEAPDTVERQ